MRCPTSTTAIKANIPKMAVKVGNTASGIAAPNILRVSLQAELLEGKLQL